MRRAAVGSFLFFLAAPVGLGLVVPLLITGWGSDRDVPAAVISAGCLLAAAGLVLVAACFTRFVAEGRGTPAPIAPTERLVVGGIYRHVRNPMYVGVIALILGQALALLSPGLLAYAAAFTLAVVTFVRLYEEPVLRETYGASFERYREAVPGWLPRLRPWDG